MLHGCTVQQKAHIIKVPISNHSKAHRGCRCPARAPRPHRGNDLWSNTGEPSQDAPTQTAHRNLENLNSKHKTCLPSFCLLVANKSQRLQGSFCPFREASRWLRLSPGGTPNEPKFAARAAWQYRPHGASSKTISGWCHGVRCHHVHTPSTEGAERACYVMFVPCVLHVECTHQRSRDGVCLCRRVGDVSKRRNALCFTRRYTGPHTPRKCGLLLASMGMPQRAGNHRRCGTQV